MKALRALNSSLGIGGVFALSALAACAPDVSTMRMGGVFPPREANCSLELRSGTIDFAMTSQFDTVGTLMVRGSEGEAPNSPRILALIKPEACKLGGEMLLLNTSANLTNGMSSSSNHTFLVFRKKGDNPAATQKF